MADDSKLLSKKDKDRLEELLAKKQEVADWGGGTVKFPRPQPGPVPVTVSKMDDDKQKILNAILNSKNRSRA